MRGQLPILRGRRFNALEGNFFTLCENLGWVLPMTAITHQSMHNAHETIVFFTPSHRLDVEGGNFLILHFFSFYTQ
jgi:hypothetical protein